MGMGLLAADLAPGRSAPGRGVAPPVVGRGGGIASAAVIRLPPGGVGLVIAVDMGLPAADHISTGNARGR